MASKSVERFKQGSRIFAHRRQRDSLTDHPMYSYVCSNLGGIACAARAIPPNNITKFTNVATVDTFKHYRTLEKEYITREKLVNWQK